LPPEPEYVPKVRPGDPLPWLSFGSAKDEYERWVPEICGICCLKMIGDTVGTTRHQSLYQLTMMAVENGTFTIGEAGRIHGAYHKPLSELAQTFGIPCEVAANLTTARIRREIGNGRYAILSVDLGKVDSALRGGHLVLVYAHDGVGEFLLHDCSSVLRQNGRAVKVTWSELENMSNRKGLIAGI
jgi:hypothetical protein